MLTEIWDGAGGEMAVCKEGAEYGQVVTVLNQHWENDEVFVTMEGARQQPPLPGSETKSFPTEHLKPLQQFQAGGDTV